MTEIQIESGIEESISKRIKNTNFEGVDEYVNFVLREVLESRHNEENDVISKDEGIEEQLESLGYL